MVGECKSHLRVILKAQNDRKQERMDAAEVCLEKIVELLKQENEVQVFVDEKGVEIVSEMLNCARLFKNPIQVAVNGLTIFLLIPSKKLGDKVPQVILNTMTIDSKIPPVCARALSHTLTGKKLRNYSKLVPRIIPLVDTDQTGSVLKLLTDGLVVGEISSSIADQLRSSNLPQRLIALICFKDGECESGQKVLHFDDVSTASMELLHFLMDEHVANAIKNTPTLGLISTVVTKLMNTSKDAARQQASALKLLRRYIERARTGLPSDVLTSVLEFISLESHCEEVLHEATALLKLILSDDARLMRVIHMTFIRPNVQGIEIIAPLLTSLEHPIQEFGCSVLKKISQLQFSCHICNEKLGTTGSSNTRYYTASTGKSYCSACRFTGGESIRTEGDFRWHVAACLMTPASHLFEIEMQRITSPDTTLRNVQSSQVLLDLMEVFTAVCPTNCWDQRELGGKIISVASTILSIMPAESDYMTSLLRMLASLDHPVTTTLIGTVVDKLANRIQDFSESSVIIATSIIKRSIAHAGDRISQSLCSILSCAYSNVDVIRENVASCIRQALASSSFKEHEIESIISEYGLTASLYQLLETEGCKSQAKADCIFSIHKTIRKEPRVDFLLNERSLEVLLAAFSYFQNIDDEICTETADIVKYLVTSCSDACKNSFNGSRDVNCLSSSSGSTSTPTRSPRNVSPKSSQEALRKKAKVLLTDEGFQMLWMFASSVEKVKNDAIQILLGLSPVLVSAIVDSDRTDSVTPYLLGILIELSKDSHRLKYSVAPLFQILAAEPTTSTYFNQQAVSALFDISLSSGQPQSREAALLTLKSLHEHRVLVVRDAPDIAKTIRFRLGNHTKKLTFSGQPTLSKLKASIQEACKEQGESIQVEKTKLCMGTTVITDDSDLCLMSGVINVEIEEGVSGTPRTPHRKPNWLHTFARPLGKGAFGQVYLVVSGDGHQYAAKCMTSTRKSGEQLHRKNQESFMNEIRLLSSLEHPNIVRYYDTASKDNIGYIIMEYVPGGSLLDFKKLAGSITEEMAGNFIVHALRGIGYLHEHNVIHLDVKSANLLIDVEGVVKVADFGCGVIFDESNAKGPANGTILFMAPEVLTRRSYSFASDIWSLGCTLIEMLFGLLWNPKLEDNGELQLMHHLRNQFSNGVTPLSCVGEGKVSKSCRQFLEKCLQLSPEDRLTASQLLNGDPIEFTGTGTASGASGGAPDAIQQHLRSVIETNQSFETSSDAFTFATATNNHISAPPSILTAFAMQGPPTALQGPPTALTAIQGPPTVQHNDPATSTSTSSVKSTTTTKPSLKKAKRGTLPKFTTTSPKIRTPTGAKSREWSDGTSSKWLQGNPSKHKE